MDLYFIQSTTRDRKDFCAKIAFYISARRPFLELANCTLLTADKCFFVIPTFSAIINYNVSKFNLSSESLATGLAARGNLLSSAAAFNNESK